MMTTRTPDQPNPMERGEGGGPHGGERMAGRKRAGDPMTTPDLQWLAQLGEEATEGPWTANSGYDITTDRAPDHPMYPRDVDVAQVIYPSDGVFIATARNLWAEMVAVVEAAEGLLAARGSEGVFDHWARLSDRTAALAAKVNEERS